MKYLMGGQMEYFVDPGMKLKSGFGVFFFNKALFFFPRQFRITKE